jgi:hypothetical protein
VGIDTNGNGILDTPPDTVASSAKVCNGTGGGGGTPLMSIGDSSGVESPTATYITFTISLNFNAPTDIIVNWDTMESGSATADVDYASDSGQATILTGTDSTTIDVEILDDADVESSEDFTVVLSNAFGANIADDTATGTINDND